MHATAHYFDEVMNIYLLINAKRPTTRNSCMVVVRIKLSLPVVYRLQINVAHGAAKPSSFNLFRKIPMTRTCSSAGIDLHWCTCTYSENANVNDDVISATAEWVVDYINSRLEPVIKQCHRLKYDRLLDAKYLIPNNMVGHALSIEINSRGLI